MHRVVGLLLVVVMAIAGTVPPVGAAASAGPAPAVPIVRLAGPDRVATAVQVSRHGWDGADMALLATAASFPDALAGASLARRLDAPVLLTPAEGLAPLVAEELVRLGVQRVVLLGGTAALSDAVAEDARRLPTTPAVDRVAGASRFETAAAIAQAAGLSGRTVALVSGERFPDALAASSLAATQGGAPILLTGAADLPTVTEVALVGLRQEGAEEVVIVGGTAAVGDGVLEEVRQMGFETVRLAGPTRYETALRVVDHVLAADPADAAPRPLVLATGEGFPDALAAGALTARAGAVFATVPPSWPAGLHGELRRHAGRLDQAVVVGGTGAVPAYVINGVIRALDDLPWLDEPVDPLGLAWDLRYARSFTLGEDPWSVWVCHVPPDTVDTTISPERLAVDLEHAGAAAQALADRWWSGMSAGRWRPTFTIGGEVTVPADHGWVRGGCVDEALTQLPQDTPVQGVLVVLDSVGGVAVGGAHLFDTCDEQRCGIDTSIHQTRRFAVMPAEHLAPFDGSTSLVTLAHEMGHAVGWPHVYRPNPDSDSYEDPMDLMASAAGWPQDGWILPSATMAFNRYAAGWIDPNDVAVHRGGTTTHAVSALGSPGVQLVAVPGSEAGALVTLEARVWDSIDRAVPAEGVQVGIVDQRGYPCGNDSGTCSGHRRMAPAMGRLRSADHVLDVGEGADVLGLRIDVAARSGSTFTVTVSGGSPDVPRFTD